MAESEEDCKCEEGAPSWMVTFADLMTLLLTFFVLLLSMSTLDTQKIKLALGSLRGALGVVEGGGQPREGRKEMSRLTRIAQGERELMTTIERVVKKQNDKVSNDFIQLGHKDDKVFIAIPDSLLFAPGSTEVLPTAYPFLDDLAGTLAGGSAVAEFIGHADDSAPSGFYASNWEVSAARALSVLQYVQESGGVEGYRFKASAHAQYLPRSVNDTPVGRASNRRVEVVMTVTSATDRYFYGEAREIREIPGSSDTP